LVDVNDIPINIINMGFKSTLKVLFEF
jgi:hypothetical protein